MNHRGGPIQRAVATASGAAGNHDALESAEAGYTAADSIGPSLGVRSSTTTRRISHKFARRRKSASLSMLGQSAAAARAKMRRFLLRMQKNPRQLRLFTTSMVVLAALLGIWFVVFIIHYSTLGVGAVRSDVIISTTQTMMTNHAPTTRDYPRRPAIVKLEKDEAVSPRSLEMQHHLLDQELPSKKKYQVSVDRSPEMKILIDSIRPVSPHQHAVKIPSNDDFDKELGLYPEFSGLEIVFFDDPGARRNVVRNLEQYDTTYRDPDAKFDDDVDAYYFNDDDYLRGLDTAYDADDDQISENKVCRKIAEHELNFQNCNEFHQLDRLDPSSELKYLNAGGYREVFSMVHPVADEASELIALKDTSYDHEMKIDDYEFVRMDAIVAERLSASPRIYDIYGFCGLGILSEYFYHGDIEGDVSGGENGSGYMKKGTLHDEEQLKPQNNLTGIQKLVLALEMAEALADLHGYANGLIVHDDVQLAQFLLNKDQTRLKLNDFNRAEFPLFDEEKNAYCHYKNGKGHGNWRAPEEYRDKPLTEQIDVWSLGNNMYTLLTGLNPLYEIRRDREFTKNIIGGKTAFVDPRWRQRSPSEAALCELIPRCFQSKAENRPTMFEIVNILRDAVAQNLDPGVSREKVLQGIRTKS